MGGPDLVLDTSRARIVLRAAKDSLDSSLLDDWATFDTAHNNHP